MNNLDWYTKVTCFCKAYQRCTECPFFLINFQDSQPSTAEKTCFTSKQSLEQLSTWLAEPVIQEYDQGESDVKEDTQWLKDLLRGQFGDEDDRDAFYLDDDFT